MRARLERWSSGRQPTTGLLLLCLLYMGCSGAQDSDSGFEDSGAAYEHIVEQCSQLAWHPTMTVYEIYDEMSAECAQALGDSVGLDWESFNLVPGEADETGAGTFILAGIFALAMDRSGPRGELLEDTMMPLVFRAELTVHGNDESSAGAVWLSVMRRWVSSITYGGSLDSNLAAVYWANTRTLVVGELLHTWAGTVSPAYSAAALIHEASHGFVERHTPCTSEVFSGQCDSTPEGAFGIQVWWISNWMLAHEVVLSHPECEELEEHKMSRCSLRIESYAPDWEPCHEICR